MTTKGHDDDTIAKCDGPNKLSSLYIFSTINYSSGYPHQFLARP